MIAGQGAKADRARQYADRVAGERLAVGGDGVTVVMGLDGFLDRVYVTTSIRHECAPGEVAWRVLRTIRDADHAAAERRRELARQLTVG